MLVEKTKTKIKCDASGCENVCAFQIINKRFVYCFIALSGKREVSHIRTKPKIAYKSCLLKKYVASPYM